MHTQKYKLSCTLYDKAKIIQRRNKGWKDINIFKGRHSPEQGN